MPYNYNKLGDAIPTIVQSSLLDIDTASYGANFDAVDTVWLSGSLAPQIVDTTEAPAYRQVNFQGNTAINLASGNAVAFGVPLAGTSPDEQRPWLLRCSVVVRVIAASRVLVGGAINRHGTGTLSAARNAVTNVGSQPYMLQGPQTNLHDGTSNLCSYDWHGDVLIGEFDETTLAIPNGAFDDESGPKTNPVQVMGYIVNPTGAAVAIQVALISVTVARDVGGINLWEPTR